MLYKNTVSGEVINVNSVINGGNWESIKAPETAKKAETKEAKPKAPKETKATPKKRK